MLKANDLRRFDEAILLSRAIATRKSQLKKVLGYIRTEHLRKAGAPALRSLFDASLPEGVRAVSASLITD